VAIAPRIDPGPRPDGRRNRVGVFVEAVAAGLVVGIVTAMTALVLVLTVGTWLVDGGPESPLFMLLVYGTAPSVALGVLAGTLVAATLIRRNR
jgi:hypothetical protein